MEQEFWAWHKKKIELQNKAEELPFFYEREIWWASIGLNIGFEEFGKGVHFERPVLILRKFNQSFFLGVPMSTTAQRGKYYHEIITDGVSRTALLSQLRAFDAKRLRNKVGFASKADFASVQFKAARLLSSNSPPPACAGGRGRNPFVP